MPDPAPGFHQGDRVLISGTEHVGIVEDGEPDRFGLFHVRCITCGWFLSLHAREMVKEAKQPAPAPVPHKAVK